MSVEDRTVRGYYCSLEMVKEFVVQYLATHGNGHLFVKMRYTDWPDYVLARLPINWDLDLTDMQYVHVDTDDVDARVEVSLDCRNIPIQERIIKIQEGIELPLDSKWLR